MRVYRYESIERPSRHCREEIAVDRFWHDKPGDGGLFDNFWGGGSETHRLTDAERKTAKFLFDTDDFEEVKSYSRGAPQEWLDRKERDRQRLTSQHGLRVVWYIRKDSQPDRRMQIKNARVELAERESELRSATSRVEWAKESLDALLSPVRRTT